MRRQTLCRLRDAYAAGHITVGTLEHRVEAALGARSPVDLDEATWDLPSIEGSLWRAVQSLTRATDDRPPARRLLFRLAPPVRISFDEGPGTWLIGRSRACDVTVRDPAVSRRHALVSTRGGMCAIRDLDSTNGLLVNGVRVSSAALRPGDEISLGGAVTAEVR